MKRTIVHLFVPLLVYVPGAVDMMLDDWYYACLSPCFAVITAPIERTFVLIGGTFGLVGQILFTLVIVFWAFIFLGQFLTAKGVTA